VAHGLLPQAVVFLMSDLHGGLTPDPEVAKR
jgi:hypothetical protein